MKRQLKTFANALSMFTFIVMGFGLQFGWLIWPSLGMVAAATFLLVIACFVLHEIFTCLLEQVSSRSNIKQREDL